MRSGIDLHVHSPKFNLHADLHNAIRLGPEGAQPEEMASGYRQLATGMRRAINLHVHSPKFNLHADLHLSVSVQRALNQSKWHQDISRD